MDQVIYFESRKDLFESKPDYRKVVLLMFSFKNDVDLSSESGFVKNDINRLYRESKIFDLNKMKII